jgi:hypothetical protein
LFCFIKLGETHLFQTDYIISPETPYYKGLSVMFIYSLPLFFTQIGLASPLELLIIFLALFVVLYISLPLGADNLQKQSLDNYLFAAWSGSVALKWVFWPFFLILNASLYAADSLAKSGMLTVSSWDDVHLMLLLPIVWWTAAIWRCSANTELRFGAACARLLTLAVFLEYGLKLMIRIDYPRIFFGCEELLLDYGSCF